MLRTLSFTILTLTLASGAVAQSRTRTRGGFDLSAHGFWSRQYASGSPANNTGGGGLGLGYRLPIGLAIELRGSYRAWEGESYVPLHLGVRYEVPVHPLVSLAPFAGAGPSLVWGNDWASVFASFDVGARAYVSLGANSRARLMIEGGYGRAMTFHPSEFGVLNLGGGLSIGL